jgi:hypothetical protein
MDNSHLLPQVAGVLSLPTAERILWMKDRKWVGYPKAKEIMDILEALYTHPRVDRMPNLLIIGRTNNGKSSIGREFETRHPVEENPGGEHIVRPVVFVECPAEPTEASFYAQIIREFYGANIPGSLEAKKSRVLDLLHRVGTKVLFVDELHNISGLTAIKQHLMLTALKTLSNLLRISIVGTGDTRLPRLLEVDAQIQNRFEQVVLPKWKCDRDFRQLLMSIERVLPLKEPSNLHSKEMAQLLYAKCEGTIGELSKLLNLVAENAILSGLERITLDGVRDCRYVSPADRSRDLDDV